MHISPSRPATNNSPMLHDVECLLVNLFLPMTGKKSGVSLHDRGLASSRRQAPGLSSCEISPSLKPLQHCYFRQAEIIYRKCKLRTTTTPHRPLPPSCSTSMAATPSLRYAPAAFRQDKSGLTGKDQSSRPRIPAPFSTSRQASGDSWLWDRGLVSLLRRRLPPERGRADGCLLAASAH